MKVKTSTAKEILKKSVPAKIPTLLVGSPGIGKSDIGAQVAQELEMDYVTSHPVVEDETDKNGLPSLDAKAGVARWLPFEFIHSLINASKPTLWHIEDIGQARPAIQAGYMQTLLTGRLGDHQLPDCVHMMASTNRREDRAGVSGMLEPVKGRFNIIHVEADLESWLADFAIPNKLPQSIISFLRLRPELLCKFEPSADIHNSPNPRNWARVAKLEGIGLDSDEELPAFAGSIGEGAAIEYVAHKRVHAEIPQVEEILTDPDGTRVPESPAALYAISTAVAFAVDKKTISKFLRYIQRLPMEFGVLTIRDMLRNNPQLVTTPDWTPFLATDLGKLCTGED